MRNLIILEGPDCAGKTTLARELVKFGFDATHFGADLTLTGADMTKTYLYHLSKLYKCVQNGHTIHHPHHVVFDRCWISEIVYGPIYRGVSRFSHEQVGLLYAAAELADPVIVYCRPKTETMIKSFNARIEEEMLDNAEQLQQAINKYDTIFADLEKHSDFDIHRYDYEVTPNKDAFIYNFLLTPPTQTTGK
jgi:thymidylate kinase